VSWEYGRLATEVYELDKPVGRTFPGLEYYARQLAGITGRILEPACGTGRVLIPLLEAGLAVEGLDSSPDMLAVCRQPGRDRGRAGDNVRALLGTCPVPVDDAGHAYLPRLGREPGDQPAAVREVA
jgi:SAM-dependent methyltransferase